MGHVPPSCGNIQEVHHLDRKFSREKVQFSEIQKTVKVFSLKGFAVYGTKNSYGVLLMKFMCVIDRCGFAIIVYGDC